MRSFLLERVHGLGVVGLSVGLLLGVVGCTATTALHSGAPSAADSSSSSAVRAGACTVDQLTITIDSSHSGQQTIEPALVLTNRSTRACTTQGAPVVVFVDRSGGRRIGPVATTERSQPKPEVTLQPGGSAEVDLIADFPDKTSRPCRQHVAAGFEVVLPRTHRPVFVAYPYPACENKRLLAVFPVQPR
jgi:hypothetical protein